MFSDTVGTVSALVRREFMLGLLGAAVVEYPRQRRADFVSYCIARRVAAFRG